MGKKVYLSVDIEGVAGVVDRAHGNRDGGPEYELGRRLMTEETNAAIEGALEAGATEIVVNDSHGQMRNLMPELLHSKATLIQGRVKHAFMVEGLDDSFDAVFLVGYHAPAGTRDGVLNHAFHPYELRYNGVVWSEIGLSASVAGHFGVPVALVTGDDAAIRVAKATIPPHVGVSVKRGITRLAGESLHPAEARARIRDGARRAIERLGEFTPLTFDGPIAVEMDFYYSPQADVAALIPTVERVGDRTVRYQAADAAEAYRTFLATYYITRDVI
ncbi:MAG TPA: M55 family metallopeptidase [Solirubrobacteraceae bacterium]|nr:M55 family metallopeptidase [Solirubrobacteraceae bacterium]